MQDATKRHMACKTQNTLPTEGSLPQMSSARKTIEILFLLAQKQKQIAKSSINHEAYMLLIFFFEVFWREGVGDGEAE